MMMTMFSHELNFPEIWPVVTKQAETLSMGKKKTSIYEVGAPTWYQ